MEKKAEMHLLAESEIFRGISGEEVEELLKCLGAYRRSYKKGEFIFYMGEKVENMGFVLLGSVNIEKDDVWGNQSILGHVEPGEVFGETYACVQSEHLMVHVVAAENTEVLFLNMDRMLLTCQSACGFHNQLIRNLVNVMAAKNLGLTRKINDTSPKSIRGRLLSYLSYQALKQGSYRFEIPFNRQQLADYLSVDRSAMSNELSKMQAEGLLEYKKNRFRIKAEQ